MNSPLLDSYESHSVARAFVVATLVVPPLAFSAKADLPLPPPLRNLSVGNNKKTVVVSIYSSSSSSIGVGRFAATVIIATIFIRRSVIAAAV